MEIKCPPQTETLDLVDIDVVMTAAKASPTLFPGDTWTTSDNGDLVIRYKTGEIVTYLARHLVCFSIRQRTVTRPLPMPKPSMTIPLTEGVEL